MVIISESHENIVLREWSEEEEEEEDELLQLYTQSLFHIYDSDEP